MTLYITGIIALQRERNRSDLAVQWSEGGPEYMWWSMQSLS
jgi:hypothetical protein